MEHTGPTRFGPYVVLEQIGAGGMGAVFRARDQRLERDVAIKVLHRHLEMAGAKERFLREARAVSSLNHPNISTIFDIGEQDGDPYLVMELLHGESLRERLSDGDAVSQPELESIATQTALALVAAHAKGIVHRDIKPANLFLIDGPSGEKQVKVLDFGLAKLESDRVLYGDSGGLTRTGSTVGTVEYMSPEQARGEELDARSDLFSLGAVLYELATGDVPFRGATSAVIFSELLGKDPIPPRSANSSVTPGMDAIIRRLLEKKRDQRMASAAVLLDELRRMRETRPMPARPRISPAPPQATVAAPPKAVAPAKAVAPPVATPSIAPDPPLDAVAPIGQGPKHTVEVTEPAARSQRGRPTSVSRVSAVHPRASGGRPSVTRESVREPLRQGVSAETPVYRDPDREEVDKPSRNWLLPVAAVVLLALAAAAYFFWPRGGTASGSSVLTGGLQVTQFENSTGDASLQEIPAVALQILLREAPGLHVTGYAPAPNTVEIDAVESARRSGAEAYLTGALSRDGEKYHVHAEVLRTADNSKLAQEDLDAASIVELPNALSRMAIALRGHFGETAEQATAGTVPLSAEASSSMAALSAFARGTSLLRFGQPLGAIDQFNRALTEDAGFAAARLGLVQALRSVGAEPERREAAGPLAAMAGKVSACSKAAIAYETADGAAAGEAAQRWTSACPQQPEAFIALSHEFLVNGKGGEAETAGTRAVALDPAGRGALTASTEALISQAHYESAQKEQATAAQLQAGSPGLALIAAYLRGNAAGEAAAAATAEGATNFADQALYVTYLANSGRLADAVRFGQAASARMSAQATVASTGVVMQTRLAALQAMAGHCDAASSSPAGGGDQAAYFAGIAAAWCKRAVSGDAPKDPTLAGILRAATTWGGGDAEGALNVLQGVRPSSQAPVAALLRGETHLARKEQVQAIGDYKAVITRRGAAVLTGTLVYPAAQAGLAHAYKSMGDEPNANRAAEDLKSTWKDAAANEPLLRRAEN